MKSKSQPIILTGCARSGTSMMAGCVHLSGAFGGVMSGPTRYNAKGYFENVYIKETLEKGYLREHNLDPLGQLELPVTKKLKIPFDWRAKVNNHMIGEGYKSGPWFYKGAKACLIWPVWHYAYPNAKWVIVRREKQDIVKSCLDTAFMHKRTTKESWGEWVDFHIEKFNEMINEGLNIKTIWPEKMVKGDYQQLYELIEWLGLKWDLQKMTEFVEPKLWKSREQIGIKSK